MFAKALEGAYITLGYEKKLMLTRNSVIYERDEARAVFECAVCDDCGRIAVAGREVDRKLKFQNNTFAQETEYYLLRSEQETDFESEEDDGEHAGLIGKNDYLLCSKCGAVIHESLRSDPACICGMENYVRVRKAQNNKCPSCSFGHLKTFYLGYDAATAVLGTSLFEELPESEKVLTSKKPEPERSLFRPTKAVRKPSMIKRKRQFLSFSDSRGEAAFFASYMTASYKEFLRRRGIWHIVEKE